MIVVALACGGEAATPTSLPTATQPAPTATATVAATATPVPEATATPDMRADFVNYLLNHPGYQEKWGTPQWGGVIKTADPAVASNFQTTLGYAAFSRWQFCCQNSLLMMDPWLEIDAPVMCDLCESFEMSADGLTYTFKLRKGVKFQSEGWGKDKGAPGFGTELVCEDIKASQEWHARPHEATMPSFINTGFMYMGHLDNVTCPDGPQGYTAVLNFKYFRNLTTGWLASGIAIWDKEYREWMDKAYPGIQSTAKEEGFLINMGTGPQIPISAENDRVMKVRVNPNYFLGRPFADGWEYWAILDYNTKYASWVTGKIHQIGHGSSGLTKAQVVQTKRDLPDYTIHIVRYNHISWIRLNPMRPPFDNWKVRWAIQLTLDRGAWLQFSKAGDVAMADPVYYLHADSPWAIPKEESQKFPGFRQDKKDEDIKEANRLLDEVFGVGNRPKDLTFYVWTLLSRREPGLWAIDQMKTSLKWEFTTRMVEQAEYTRIGNECTYTAMSDAAPVHSMGYSPDPSDAFVGAHTILGTARPKCYIRGYNEYKRTDLETELARIDKLIEELDTSRDQVRRLEISRYLEVYMMEERVTAANLGTMNVAWGTRPELRGVHYYNLGTYSQQRLHDRMWLAQ